jgi:hypothetical protein
MGMIEHQVVAVGSASMTVRVIGIAKIDVVYGGAQTID